MEGVDSDCAYGVTHGDPNAGNRVSSLGSSGFGGGLGDGHGRGVVFFEAAGEGEAGIIGWGGIGQLFPQRSRAVEGKAAGGTFSWGSIRGRGRS